jgi:amphi-Trp domain-containing protein
MKNILFKSEEMKSNKEAADILRQIADKIEEGNILLKKGSKEVTVKIPSKLEVEIEASKKEKEGQTKKQLEIEIEWIEGENGEVSIK